MFTGLIEEIGKVTKAIRSKDSFDLIIQAKTVLEGIALGDSIAVNGVCLTVTKFDSQIFQVGLAPETRKRTNLGDLHNGALVNLERSVTPSTRLGGHFVQGHVDDTGTIKSITNDEDALWITISCDPRLMGYIVTKGYITIDGTSLTVVDTGSDWFNITLIAYSQQKVTLARKAIGESVNLEVDILAKYVEKLVAHQSNSSPEKPENITRSILSTHGFIKEGTS